MKLKMLSGQDFIHLFILFYDSKKMIEFSSFLNSLRKRLVCDSFDKNDMKASIHSSQIKRIFGASKSQVKNFEVQICSFHFPPIALAISKSILHSPHVLT